MIFLPSNFGFMQPSVPAGGGGTEVIFIANNDDDCTYTSSGKYDTLCRIGKAAANSFQYLRFLNVEIPQGATIVSAKVTFIAAANYSGNVDVLIYGEDEDTGSSQPANYSAYVALSRTTSYVNWVFSTAWTTSNSYDTPDMKDVIQGIVDRGGWVSGNDITILIDENNSSSRRHGTDYTVTPADVCCLTIEWTN